MLKYYAKEVKYFHGRKILFMAIMRYFLSETPLRLIVNSKLYKKIYLRRIKKVAENMEPIYFSFESNNVCNAKCIMCPYPSMERKGKMGNFDLFKKAVDEALKYFKPRQIALSGFGEPTLSKDLVDRVRYIKGKSSVRVKFFTNASLLNEKLARELVEAGLDEMNISVNAASKENYEKIMVLNYENTLNNIKNLIKIKREYKSKKPVINVSMMKLDENKKEVKEFRNKWIELVDSVVVRQPENWSGLKEVKNKGYPYFKIAYPCIYPFSTIDVLSNGDVVPCCRDFEGREVLGNIEKQTLWEIWNSKKYRKFRRKHIEEKFNELEVCKDCDTNIVNPFYWWQTTHEE